MRIFIDSADVEAIRKAYDTGLVDGVTTNPSFIAKSGRKFTDVVKDICSVVKGPVSVEVMAETCEGMVEDAQKVAELSSNIAVKIPMTVEGLKAVPILEQDKKIQTNVTMIFSSTQCYLAMKAGASYVSIVLSRLDAIANESVILLEDAVTVKSNYGYSSNILAASLKTQNHLLASLRVGADVVTIPDTLFFQMYKHPLTDSGLDAFSKDWAKVPK